MPRGRFRVSRERSHPLSRWIDDIKKAWGRGATKTIELASIVSQARRSLAYGGWSDLWRTGEMPFSKRKAEMLVVIGEGVENLNANTCAHLPIAWRVLYYLALMGRREIERLVRQGRIHPSLSLRQARALLAEHQPGAVRKVPRPNVKARLDRFAEFVETTLAEWSRQERVLAQRQLLALLARVSGHKNHLVPGVPRILRV